MKNKIIVCLSIACSSVMNAQLSELYTDPNVAFKKAEELYLQEAYRASGYEFQTLSHFGSLTTMQKEYAQFYAAMSSLLYQDTFALQEYDAFERNYPESNLLEQTAFPLGNYYLKTGDFDQALKQLKQVDEAKLSSYQKDNYNFNLGYAYFMNENFSAAKNQLNKVQQNDKYKSASDFMLGHIAYVEKDYNKANEYFEKIASNTEYNEIIKPYLAQIYYNKKEYNKAIQEGEDLLRANTFPELKGELSKIVGESYFQQKNYTKALPYLEAYIAENKAGTSADYYQLGYVNYHNKNYAKAVSYFNQITNEKSAMAQNAYYQLGNSYLQTNQKTEALTAYKSASEMEFNKEQQQLAFYNYGKLSYEVGNPYTSVANVLQAYIKKYPNSKERNEISSLLLKSYLKSKNYAGALEALNQIKNKTIEEEKIEQEVALQFGIQQYNSGNYAKAVEILPKAFKNYNTDFYAKALFWCAESYYLLEKYNDAVSLLKKMEAIKSTVVENQQLPYALGYNYLKQKDFKNASAQFQQYLQNPKEDNKADAKMRLADAYYGNNDFGKAQNAYEEVISDKNSNSEEALFNKAMILGFQDEVTKKMAALESFIKIYPKSEYLDDAYYELGISYTINENYTTSNQYFDKVINEKNKENELVGMSYLGRAQNYALLMQNDKAINEYKFIVKEFKNTDYAAQAIIAAKRIFVEENRIKEYETWATNNGYQISNEEAEELQFDYAYKFYKDKNYTEAITAYKDYWMKFPNSAREITVKYYLGNSYFKLKKDNEALALLTEIAKTQNQHQEDALYQVATIQIDQENDNEAKLALEALLEVTQNNNYINFAQLELMYLYANEKNDKKTQEYAEKVLINTKNSDNDKEMAKLFLARVNYNEGNVNKAKTEFTTLEKSKNDEIKSEALYYKALFLFKDKKYDQSKKAIINLASNLSDQPYWSAKSLVLLGNIYYKLNDKYQATYTLEEVNKNYSEFPDVTKEAQTILDEIKNAK